MVIMVIAYNNCGVKNLRARNLPTTGMHYPETKICPEAG